MFPELSTSMSLFTIFILIITTLFCFIRRTKPHYLLVKDIQQILSEIPNNKFYYTKKITENSIVRVPDENEDLSLYGSQLDRQIFDNPSLNFNDMVIIQENSGNTYLQTIHEFLSTKKIGDKYYLPNSPDKCWYNVKLLTPIPQVYIPMEIVVKVLKKHYGNKNFFLSRPDWNNSIFPLFGLHDHVVVVKTPDNIYIRHFESTQHNMTEPRQATSQELNKYCGF